MKIIFSILIILYTLISSTCAENKIRTLANVNESIITNIDTENEIILMKLLENNINYKNINTNALENLITYTLKEQEIKKYKIEIDPKNIKNKYDSIVYELEKLNKISDNLKKKIYSKIEIDYGWNLLIKQLYSWKVSVNMHEIESKANTEVNKDNKDKIILEEKNKKLQIYSANHLSSLKKKSFIKIY